MPWRDRFQAPRGSPKETVGEKDVHVTRTGDFRFGDRGMVCQRRQNDCARSRGFCPSGFASCKQAFTCRSPNSGLEAGKAEAPSESPDCLRTCQGKRLRSALAKLGAGGRQGCRHWVAEDMAANTSKSGCLSEEEQQRWKASSARRPPRRRGAPYRGGGNEGAPSERAVSYLQQANFA